MPPKKAKKTTKPRLNFAGGLGNRNQSPALITLVTADPALAGFPAQLSADITTFLRTRLVDRRNTFTSSAASFDLFSYEGRPCRFVVGDTLEVLDAAIYRYDMLKEGKTIIVVQNRSGSTTFNNGRPAIIRYYGKGASGKKANNKGDKACFSRYTVWTPDGFASDKLVRRVYWGGLPVQNTPADSINSNDEDNERDAAATTKVIKRAQNTTRNLRTTHSGDSTQALSDGLSSTDQRVDDDGNADEETLFIPIIRSLKRGPPDPAVKLEHNKRRLLSLEDTTPSSPTTSTTRQTTAQSPASSTPVPSDPVKFFFKTDNSPSTPIALIKPLVQCNTNRLLFAYARKARIAANYDLLVAYVGDETLGIQLFRDDDYFLEVKEAIEREQGGDASKEVDVIIVPVND